MGVADAGLFGHDGDVAQQCVRCREADCVAINGGNDRLVELKLAGDGAAADHGVVHLAFFEDIAARPLRHRLDVAADAEEITGAGQHHAIDGVIIAQIVPDRSQLADQFLVDGVARLRPVQRHGRHLVRDLDLQAFVFGISRHIDLPCIH
jgi:hypothetical protein